MKLPALLRRLLTCPCLSCAAPVWRWSAALCEACTDRLPVVERWDYRSARDWRLLNRKTYRDVLHGPHGDDGVLAWLATHPRPDTATQTTTKES